MLLIAVAGFSFWKKARNFYILRSLVMELMPDLVHLLLFVFV